ncbi:MAG: hypothetical protein QM817_40745 [Archangium sp.]
MDNDDKQDLPTPTWLTRKETLFEEGEDWEFNVDHSGGGLNVYAQSYRQAAEQLFSQWETKDHTPPHYALFPLAFLWRQYLELRLKSLVLDVERLHELGEEVPTSAQQEKRRKQPGYQPDFPDGHDLLQQWDCLEPMLKSLWPSAPETKFVRHLLVQFNEVDPLADGFRYPVGSSKKARARTLSRLPRLVNLRRVNDVMTSLANVLDGASDHFEVALSDTLEALAWYEAEEAALAGEVDFDR